MSLDADLDGEALVGLPERQEVQHSEECEERRYLHHVATGGDMECICGASVVGLPERSEP